METVRIYLKGTPDKFITAKSREAAEKAVSQAMVAFDKPRDYFYIMDGSELEHQRLLESAYRLNKKHHLGVDMPKPVFKF